MPDAATLSLSLAQPDSAFRAKLAHPVAAVVERRVVEQYGMAWTRHLADNGGQGTSGMYRVRTYEERGADDVTERLVLERDPRFWGAKPKLREVALAMDSFRH